MPACRDPVDADFLQQLSVQAESFNCGAAASGKTDDLNAAGGPTKVILPFLSPRMKQSHAPSSEWIHCRQPRRFVAIAMTAGQTEIAFVVCAVATSWPNVFDFQNLGNIFLR
jgi:hypothetical protein